MKGLESQNIIGLCDVDWKYAEHVFQRYPAAKRYNDYRRMYDEMLKSADAVMVATADHTHAIIAADAITAGKHVYCEKPLTHTVYESRLLTKLAAKHKVATQMGNQGASAEGVRKVCEWIWNGEIGEVRKVEAFTDRPIWPQGLMRPENDERVPKTLNWDAFIGPAPMRPYNSIYTPWNFRGWWDFGTGALGDMACHILHPVFKGVETGLSDQGAGQFDAAALRVVPDGADREVRLPGTRQHAEGRHARSRGILVRRRSDADASRKGCPQARISTSRAAVRSSTVRKIR